MSDLKTAIDIKEIRRSIMAYNVPPKMVDALINAVVDEYCKGLDEYEAEIEKTHSSLTWKNAALNTISGCHGTIKRHMEEVLK